MQKLDGRHQLFHIEKIAFERIRKIQQLVALLIVSLFHFLCLLTVLFFLL